MVGVRNESIDSLRGLAVVGMVVFHALFLWRFWFGYQSMFVDNSLAYPLLGVSSAVLFFLLSGASSWLCFNRWRQSGQPVSQLAARFARRSSRIWLAALLVTLATSFISPSDTVWFGALHFLAVGNLLLLPLLFLPPKTWPALALLVVGIGSRLRPIEMQTFDYYPLLPWFSALLCGAWLAQEGRTLRWLRPWRVRPLSLLGKHSLLIYLLHVPILWVFLRVLLTIQLF